jgi:hypothetical protein
MRMARIIITYMNFTRFGLKGRTPVVLNRFAARARGKNTYITNENISQTCCPNLRLSR